MARRLAAAVVASIFIAIAPFQAPSANAEYSTCSDDTDPFPSGSFSGNEQRNGSSDSIWGVKARINPTLATFRPCSLTSEPEVDRPRATSAWVALFPVAPNSYAGNGNAVLQIGLLNCNANEEDDLVDYQVCIPGYPTNPGFLILFWEHGGCPNESAHAEKLGVINDNYHDYMIRHASSAPGSRYSLDFDGEYTGVTVFASDSDVSCWLSGRHGAQYMVETWDEGDGIADPNSKVIFSDVGWRITDSGAWQAPTWDATEDCEAHELTEALLLECNRSDAIQTQFYSWSEERGA